MYGEKRKPVPYGTGFLFCEGEGEDTAAEPDGVYRWRGSALGDYAPTSCMITMITYPAAQMAPSQGSAHLTHLV